MSILRSHRGSSLLMPLIARSLSLVVATLAVAAPAAAQFDQLSWTFTPSGSGGTGSLTPDVMMLTGPDDGCTPPGTAVSYTATAPFAGTVVATATYHTFDEYPEYDSFNYLINGVPTLIPAAFESSWAGQVVFDVPAGASFGFSVGAVDCVFPGEATLSDFDFFPLAVDAMVDSVLAGEQFGSALAAAGDLNGDGVPDLLVGAPAASVAGLPVGRVVAMSAGLDATLLVVAGHGAGDAFGFAVAGGADVNGDGVPDLLVGAPKADAPTALDKNAGRVQLRSGAGGAVLQTLVGDAAFDQLGFAVAFVGDVDGDGVADLAVGAPFHDAAAANAGTVRVHSGATGALLFTILGQAADDRLGSALAAAGDIDGDGVPDLVAGAPGAEGPGPGAGWGHVNVHSGADGSALFSFTHPGDGQAFGTAVAGGGDVDADGVPDVVGGAPLGPPGWNVGAVYVHSGADGALLHAFAGLNTAGRFGSAVAVPGDVDRDGCADVLIGAPQGFFGAPGAAQLRSGRTGDLLLAMTGEHADSLFGSAVSGLGDVDGDGDPELAVGAPSSDVLATDAGRVLTFAPVIAWTDEGHGLAGSFGMPVLSGSGLLGANLSVKLSMQGALPHTLATLVVGVAKIQAPFKGGVLVPSPDILLAPLNVSNDGSWQMATAWPSGVPSGLDVWMQMWVFDLSGPQGFSASNGLRATPP